MRNFASKKSPSANSHRQSLIWFLEGFERSKKEIPGLGLSELRSADTQGGDDYQAHIQALYICLASYCQCARGGGKNEIAANLRLNCSCNSEELADSVSFRLFFLDHPHNHGVTSACHWQDSQICVQRKRLVTQCLARDISD